VPTLRIENKRGENIVALSSDTSSTFVGSIQQERLFEQH